MNNSQFAIRNSQLKRIWSKYSVDEFKYLLYSIANCVSEAKPLALLRIENWSAA